MEFHNCAGAPARRWKAGVLQGCAFAAAALALAGCGGDGVGALMVDPAHYEGARCNELVSQLSGLVSREAQLRNLMDKADESSGGAVIGTLTYRSDYVTVVEEEKVLKRTAAEKKCQLVAAAAAAPKTAYSSDQAIR